MGEAAVDLLLDGRLRLRQLPAGHRAGTDAVLLAAAVGSAAGLLVDAGAGVGTVGLSIALRNLDLRVALLEVSAEAAALAGENIALNALQARATVFLSDLLRGDLRRLAGLADGAADFVVSNPPFFEAGRVRASPQPARASAHVLAQGGLAAWIKACATLLRPSGKFTMIHRPAALDEILAACRGRLGGIRILPVHPRAGAAASRILVAGRKGSRAAPAILPGLVLHGPDGSFTPQAEAIHRGRALTGLPNGD